MLVLVALTLNALAVCPADPAALVASLTSAEEAFNDLDAERLHQATEDAAEQADCLTGPIDPPTAARLHRVLALRAFVDGDEEAARLSFAAARTAEPGFVFSDEVLPKNHPARALYDQASQVPLSTETAPSPAAGTLQFDGTPTLARPTARPTVAVLTASGGTPTRSAYLGPGEPMFSYPVAEARTPRARLPLAVTAGVSLAASGVMYGAARASYQRFWDADTPNGELEGLRHRTNGLYYGSVGAALLGVAAGVGVFTVHWR